MIKEIKRYTLSDNLSIDMLKKNNFKNGGYLKKIPHPKYSYNKYLADEIELHIEIGINEDGTFNFDDFDNIIVLDDNFCQPYYPFYEYDKGFPFLNELIKEYNNSMDNLVKDGILKEKNIEKENNVKVKLLKK